MEQKVYEVQVRSIYGMEWNCLGVGDGAACACFVVIRLFCSSVLCSCFSLLLFLLRFIRTRKRPAIVVTFVDVVLIEFRNCLFALVADVASFAGAQTRKDTISKRVLDDFTADRKFERDQFYFNTDDLEDEDQAPAQPRAPATLAKQQATSTAASGGHDRTTGAAAEGVASSVMPSNGDASVEREGVEPSDQYTRDYHHALQDPALAAVLSVHRKLMRYFYLQASLFSVRGFLSCILRVSE